VRPVEDRPQADPARPADVGPADQPTAPYLDAVVAYGFRGSTRFHVPGHKGGAGADPGLRSAIGVPALGLDVPQDIEGIDLGPSPTPYERAEALAAEAYGAARTWFLTNGATRATTPSRSPSPRSGPTPSSSATRTPR
jgi:arginine decarboxylase